MYFLNKYLLNANFIYLSFALTIDSQKYSLCSIKKSVFGALTISLALFSHLIVCLQEFELQ